MTDSITLNDSSQIVVVFSKPDRKDYNASKPKSCPPILRGEGCYGDCSDCFTRNLERFENYRRFAINKMCELG